MEIINHECYVSLEVAKLLKQAGFDWEVKFFYRDGILRSVLPDELFNGDFEDVEYYYKHIGIPHQSLDYNDGSSKFLEEYSAPTLDVAQRWLREVKECVVIVETHNVEAACVSAYIYCIYPINPWYPCKHINGFAEEQCFDTYEQALEAGIKKALELILEEEK